MKIFLLRLLGYGCVFVGITSCGNKSPTATDVSKTETIIESKMTEPIFEDPNSLGAQVPFPKESREYLSLAIPAILRVISKQTSLSQEEAVLGKGTDHIPKGPEPVTLRYYSKKVGSENLGSGFKRRDDKHVWSEGEISFGPRNYPRGVYLMDLPAILFVDFALEKTSIEDRPDESIKRVNVFQFRSKAGNQNVQLQFEAREDVSSLQDKYPKSFHTLKITRIGD
jgi:hypothetical protein